MNYEEIMALDIEYVNHPSYSRIDPKRMMETEFPDGVKKYPKCPPGSPAYIEHLYKMPLLTPAQEIYLFRRMNYFYRAAAVTRLKGRKVVTICRYLAVAEMARNLILESNLRLVVYYAKVSDLEATFDRISEGNLILFRAVARFDYSKGFKFSTFASYAIMNRFRGMHKNSRKFFDHCQTGVDAIINETLDKSVVVDDAVRSEDAEFARDLLSNTDEREHAMLYSKYWLGKTLQEIGLEHGVTKERARQIIFRALQMMKGMAHEMV